MSQGWDVYQPLCLSCKLVSWPLALNADEDHVCGCKRKSEREPEWACASVYYCKSSNCDCPLFECVYIVVWFMLIDATLCLHSQILLVLSSAYVYCTCMCVYSMCEGVCVILSVSRRGSVSPTQSAESLYIRTRVSTINCPRCLGTGSTVELQMNCSFACKALKHRILYATIITIANINTIYNTTFICNYFALQKNGRSHQ